MITNYLAQAATSSCTLNGQPIDCAELAEKARPFIGIGITLFLILGLIFLITFILWVAMLIHAIQHNSKDRTIWIIALVSGFLLGFYPIIAIIYFFAERKKAEQADLQDQNQQQTQEPKTEANNQPEPPSTSV